MPARAVNLFRADVRGDEPRFKPDGFQRLQSGQFGLGRSVSIVVPTYNERGNIPELLRRLDRVMRGIDWEVIIVDDDSADRTWELTKSLALKDPRIRVLRRVGKRGLAGACIDGILSSSAPIVAVMDADLQHSEDILPEMIEVIASGAADLAIGSRYAGVGEAAGGFDARRAAISRFSGWVANRVLGARTSDSMSGFFAIRRERVEAIADRLSPTGFKVLLDIIASSPAGMNIAEVPYSFRERHSGSSKLDSKVALDFVNLLLNKLVRGRIPERWLLFSLVGNTGVLVHLATFKGLMFAFGDMTFSQAQTVATAVAMSSNFMVNNALTYRDRRLESWKFVRGLLLFYLVCFGGAVANVLLAERVFSLWPVWWLAASAGIMFGFLWNFSLSSRLVWGGD
jgi:dolichol-phosphate mannosyltransferase